MNYNQARCIRFINEIKLQQKVYDEDRPDLRRKDKMINEIDRLGAEFDVDFKDADEFDKEYLIERYQHRVSELTLEYYRELSSMFKEIYTIFENQLAIDTSEGGPRLNLRTYQKISEFNSVVNVLKHGKGRSLDDLKRSQSKFIQSPREFTELNPWMTSTLVLNLEYRDITNFCNEVVELWKGRYEEYKTTSTSSADGSLTIK